MPVVTEGLITRPEQLVDVLHDLLKDSDIPFEYYSKYDEDLIPAYPAVQIQPGTLDRDLGGTHTFNIGLRALIYVLHGDMTVSRQVRTHEDLLLVTRVAQLLEDNMTLDNQIIHGFVEDETPTALPPRKRGGSIIISTRMSWIGLVKTRFK